MTRCSIPANTRSLARVFIYMYLYIVYVYTYILGEGGGVEEPGRLLRLSPRYPRRKVRLSSKRL